MPSYKDQETGKIFEMSSTAFEKMLSKTKMADGRPKFVAVDGKKKELTKPTPALPLPTKAEKVAAVLNEGLQAMTAKQLIEAIQSMDDVEQLQALAQDGRKTVAKAAQEKLAGVAKEGGE
jgi:hypothetical protein